MNGNTVKSSRLAYIDNLRALMIIFVVMVHTAVTYSGIGMWYYVENQGIDLASAFFLAMFLSFTQAYFMALLFMLAGYFIPTSLNKKGTKRFIYDRMFRLGIPVLVYIFLLHPVCVMMSHPEVNIVEYYLHGIVSFDFVSWSGPLWFALLLLIFTCVYVLIRKIFQRFHPQSEFNITTQNVLLVISLIATIAFIIRIVFPIGTAVINLQFSFFSAYIIMFTIGIMGYRHGLFERIDYKTGKRWFIVSFVIGLPFWVVLILFGGPLDGIFLINGGLNWQAFAYALWESFFCVTMIIGLIGIFRNRFNSQSSFQRFLSDNAFGVYVFHAPILIGITTVMKAVTFYPLMKFVIISILAVSTSFIFSYIVRKVRFLRRIFS